MRKGILVLATAALLVGGVVIGAQKSHQVRAPEYRPGEVVVQLKETRGFSAQAARASLMQTLAQFNVQSITPLKTTDRIMTVKARTQDVTAMVNVLKQNAQVKYAEPNYIYHMDGFKDEEGGGSTGSAEAPNDPNFNLLWGMMNTGQQEPPTEEQPPGEAGTPGADIHATQAWAQSTGSNDIIVAVIDTGVDYNHDDLKDNIYTNAAEIPANSIDDDNNGFVDDVHGWNFNGHSNEAMDDNGHGTHCSGTIGAKGNNGIGVAGVTWNVRILPVKFLSAEGGGSLADAVDSIKYATKMHANIMSNSWGGGGYSQTMEDAIKEAKDAGILFIAAAGNDGTNNDSRPHYPSNYTVENVISVAASNNKDAKARFSNYGAHTVHLAAPGVRIYSTVPNNQYKTYSGTSMATPHVSGAAALLWSANREMNYQQIKDRLLGTVDPVHLWNNKTTSGGRLNILNALHDTRPPRHTPDSDSWRSESQVAESSHDYGNDSDQRFEFKHEGARYMRVHFTRIATESDYDFVRVLDAHGNEQEALTGELNDYTSDYVEGDTVILNLTSDNSVNGWGFAVDRVDFIE